MKKILSLVLALTLSVSMFTACGGNKPAETTATTAPQVSVAGTMEELLN